MVAAAILLLTGCASLPAPRCEHRIDWSAVDEAIRAARWKTDHCNNSMTAEQCETLWRMHETALAAMRLELDDILRRNREAFERGER